MARGKSQTFYRTFFLVTFLVFVISLETAAKQVKPTAGGIENKEGARFSRWLEQAEGKASKRMLPKIVAGNGKRGFVYVIAALGAAPVQPVFVKIGISRDPSKRLKNLQTGSPYPLELFYQWEVTHMRIAENEAHIAMEQFNRARLYPNRDWKTEWFDIPDGGLVTIQGIVTNAMNGYLVSKPKLILRKTLVATKFSRKKNITI